MHGSPPRFLAAVENRVRILEEQKDLVGELDHVPFATGEKVGMKLLCGLEKRRPDRRLSGVGRQIEYLVRLATAQSLDFGLQGRPNVIVAAGHPTRSTQAHDRQFAMLHGHETGGNELDPRSIRTDSKRRRYPVSPVLARVPFVLELGTKASRRMDSLRILDCRVPGLSPNRAAAPSSP